MFPGDALRGPQPHQRKGGGERRDFSGSRMPLFGCEYHHGCEYVPKSLAECVNLIRGPVGTTVRLELITPDRSQTNTVELTRQKFKL